MIANPTIPHTPKKIRLANTVFYFISGFGYATWASRIPTIQTQLHLNEAELGGLLFAMPIGLILTLPITGRILSTYSSRAVMLFGALFFSIVLSLIGFSNTVLQLTIMLFCLGSARNLLNISTNAHGLAVQALYDKSITATFHGVWSLAGFAGGAVGAIMVYYNIGAAYHLLGVSILLAIFSVLFFSKTMYQAPIPQTDKKLISLPQGKLLKLGFICFACMACENTMYDWSAIYFEKSVNVPKATATIGFVVYIAAMTTGRFLGDSMINKYGVKPVLNYSGIFIFSGLMLSVLLPYTITAGLGFILVGLGVSCVVPTVFRIAAQSTKMSTGTALASVSTIGYLGFLMVPPLVGFIAQAASLRWSFGVIAMLGALVIIVVRSLDDKA